MNQPVAWSSGKKAYYMDPKQNKSSKERKKEKEKVQRDAIIKLVLCPQKPGFLNIFVPLFLYLWPKSIGKSSADPITLTNGLCQDSCNHILSQREQDATEW